jgi:cell division transport system permease protein
VSGGMTWLLGDPAARRVLPPSGWSAGALGLLAAVVAFFAVLALALTLAAGRLAAAWDGAAGGTATLQVFATDAAIEEQARAALDVLRRTPGVLRVTIVDLAEQERLLEPWLGPEVPMESLPLPLLIEVETDRGALDAASLRERLAEAAPGAVFDDHAAWRLPLVATAAGLGRFGLASLGLLALALAAGLVLAAQRAVAAHAAAIRTLRLVGAEDGFIAGGFARRLAERAAAGAAAGTAAGMLLVALLPQGSEPGFFLVGIGLSGWQWLAPLMVPAAAAAIARAAASAATRASLRRWS